MKSSSDDGVSFGAETICSNRTIDFHGMYCALRAPDYGNSFPVKVIENDEGNNNDEVFNHVIRINN